ncbi:MAG: MFS transporter [Elusimicrobiota bacterium]|jgi:MFS family permease
MKRFTAGVLAAALIALSPGFEGYRAFGQTIAAGPTGRAPVSVPVTVVPSQVGNLPVQFTPSLPLGLSLPTLGAPAFAPSLGSVLPSAVPNAAVPSAVPGLSAAVPTLPTPVIGLIAAPVSKQNAGPENAPVSTREALTLGADGLSQAKDDGERQTVLSDLFSGKVRANADVSGPVPVFSPADASQGALAASQPQAVSIPDLEAAAVDSAKPETDRKKAVDSISALPGPEVEPSLRRIADSNPQGGASDYEVHRQALRALAGRGVILSLRPISQGHSQQILARLSQNKPTLAIFDYDDTLAPWAKPIAAETAEALKAAADAGVQPVILTDRPDASENPKETTILQSISGMTPEQKAVMGIVSSKGVRALAFDGNAEARLVRDVTVSWSAAEGDSIKAAGAAVKEKFGSVVFNGREEELSKDGYFRPLPVGMSETEVRAAAEFMKAELAKSGVDVEVVGRMAKDPTLPPYISLSKVDKSIGVSWLRTHLGYLGRLRDLAALGIKGKLFDKLAGWLGRFNGKEVPVSKMLIVGDQFFGSRVTDRNMLKAAQGALAISVGGKADPRLDNTFVWPTEGGPASTEILKGVAAKPASDFNKKAVIALFVSRTFSIGCFILTSIAYPFLAAPAVGWTVYGVLMALGPLAAIATGPLNGNLADKLSARNSMTINLVVRAALTLMLPAFAYFGILNFWTLLLSSIANGWVLSAIMTTENAYVRRLAGKHQGTVMSLASVHYVSLQAVLGLIIGIGSIIDKWNPMIAFLISAAVHGLVLAPYLWFTMPNDAPPAKAVAGTPQPLKSRVKAWFDQVKQGGRPAFEALVPGALRQHWKPALAFAASLAAYAFLHSPIPIALSLFYWVWNTDTVRAVRRGDTREIAPREEEIALTLKENAAADLVDRSEIERLKAEKAAGWEARVAEISTVMAKRAEQTKELSAEGKRWTLRQFWTILLSSLQAAVTYPFQNFALPLMATTLVGQAGKAMLLGRLTGAVFFGTLIANASQIKLPDVHIPIVGKVPAQRFIQAGVLALAATWVYTGLLPGSILAAAAAAAIAAGLMWLSSHITQKGWIKFLGAGLLAVWLPFLVWTLPGLGAVMSVQTALFLTMLIYGMFTGPATVSFNLYTQTNTNKNDLGKVFGTQGSFVNTSTSMGYGLMSLGAGMLTTAFPALLVPIGIAYVVAALAFWNAPKRMPGLPENAIEKKAE